MESNFFLALYYLHSNQLDFLFDHKQVTKATPSPRYHDSSRRRTLENTAIYAKPRPSRKHNTNLRRRSFQCGDVVSRQHRTYCCKAKMTTDLFVPRARSFDRVDRRRTPVKRRRRGSRPVSQSSDGSDDTSNGIEDVKNLSPVTEKPPTSRVPIPVTHDGSPRQENDDVTTPPQAHCAEEDRLKESPATTTDCDSAPTSRK